jgi:dipeptidyl aminopeptidase/acylaminoacyl peptidase
MHGTADKRVSPLDSIELAAELYKHGKPFRLEIFDNGDHGLHTHKNEWQAQTREWFNHFV